LLKEKNDWWCRDWQQDAKLQQQVLAALHTSFVTFCSSPWQRTAEGEESD
jgi:hypothetical protein